MIPLPHNPDPEEASYEDFRRVVQEWIDDVRTAEATLSEVGEGELKLPLRVGLIRMDLNNDGESTQEEALWRAFAQMQRRFNVTEEGAREFVIKFDRGDVAWLRGYCHICMAIGEAVLAYDHARLFERTAHLFFARPDSPYEFPPIAGGPGRGMDEWYFVDLATFIHLMRFPLAEADRLETARKHLLSATEQSEQMWSYFDRETDDDREWVPNPNQTAAIPGADMTPEMRDVWIDFLEESRAVLNGERLLRFWRATDDRGVNLRRVFSEPREFDLILWIQGTAAYPYLEEGRLTTPGLWERMERVFDRRVFRHAFWFN